MPRAEQAAWWIVVVIAITLLTFACSGCSTNRITLEQVRQISAAAYKLGVADGALTVRIDKPKTGQEVEDISVTRRKAWTPELFFARDL